MKTFLLTFISILLFPLWILAETITGQVIAITDADTIKVLYEKVPLTVRLAQIDCPEKGQAFSKRAKQLTSKLCYKNPIGEPIKAVNSGI